MTTIDYNTYAYDTPDTLDVWIAFSVAVRQQLEPHRESPLQYLFAFDGLGRVPQPDAIIGNSS